MKPLTCNRCGYQWMPRKPQKPVVCAKCKRDDWNRKPVMDGLTRATSAKGGKG